ncbi:MAG: hypothetical protein QRY74_03755 [Chlamydia sp.]
MVRLSKQTRNRSVSYKRPKVAGKRVVQKDVSNCFKFRENAITGDQALSAYIPKID